MKITFFLLPVLLTAALWIVPALAESDSDSSTPQKSESPQALKSISLSVEGMTCGSCEFHVNHAAKSVDGVHSSQADAKKGIALIEYDPQKTDLATVIRAIQAKGYTARLP